ncbi:hypothetical protein SS50377_21214 [Spironucleus salmonicida]|uniref:Uncharacterized protein n=1 Tax=Spironucleus salmonicida TaxID=348837 RepID=V6LI42_9EUKA|nr:hypothetical protein SS50377_21214 [Spironucleus salmonicida]|eukprot:EST43988.1 hypothetical protein SS50377_16296 [Spironucleus salmonicida]
MYTLNLPELLPHYPQLQALTVKLPQFQNFLDHQFPPNKDSVLQEKINNFVDQARSDLELILSPQERQFFYTILTHVLNMLPEPVDISLRFATLAIRSSQTPSFSTLCAAAKAFLSAKQPRRAEILVVSALKLQPESCEANFLAASIYRSLNLIDQALKYAKLACQFDSGNPNSWFQYGMSLIGRGSSLQLAKAAYALRKAIQIREIEQLPFPEARFNLAGLARLRMDFQVAYDQLRAAYAENVDFDIAGQAANQIEKLTAAICGRIGSRMAQLGLIQQVNQNMGGMCKGQNTYCLECRIVSKLDSGVPQIYIIQDCQKQIKCALVLTNSFHEDESGVILKITNFYAQNVRLQTKTQQYVFTAIVPKDESHGILVNGKCVIASELSGTIQLISQ